MLHEGTYRVTSGAQKDRRELAVALCPYAGKHREKQEAYANAALIAGAPAMHALLQKMGEWTGVGSAAFHARFTTEWINVMNRAEGKA